MSQTFNKFFNSNKGVKKSSERTIVFQNDNIGLQNEKTLLQQVQLFDNNDDTKTFDPNITQDMNPQKIGGGVNKLDNLTKELALDAKKVNIMNPKILESWINETLLEVERQDLKSI